MMSEDSDYTSDVNYPLQHQHNMSAHQYGADPDVMMDRDWHHNQPQQSSYYDGYYGTDRARGGRYMDRDGYGDFYQYDTTDDRSSARYYDGVSSGGGGYQRHQQRYRTERSDSESEPLSYNSRPQSYYTDRSCSL